MKNLSKYLSSSFDFKLTESQKNASYALDSFFQGGKGCFILKGYAGTGKTTLLHGITKYLNHNHTNYMVMAPTGRAAKVISDKIKDSDAFTIHKSIYAMDDLKEYKSTDKDGSETFKYYFDLHDNDSPMDTVYIVDESSMISNKYSEGEFFRFGSGLLLNDLMDYIYTRDPNSTRKILFIGDNAQLPPVNMNFSPALDNEYISKHYDCQIDEYEMTDVVRQETDSGILENATILRNKIRKKSFNKFELNTNYDDIVEIKHDDLVDTYFDCIKRNENDDSVIVTYTNSSVKNYNDSIRARLYPIEKYIQNDERLLVVQNNYVYDLLNGQFCKATYVDPESERRTVSLRVKDGNITEELIYRNVKILVEDYDGSKFIECKILENLLYSKRPRLSSEEQRALYVQFKQDNPNLKPGTGLFKEAISEDKYFNALQVKFGYAVTCHKAQGGEWDDVIVDFSTSMNKKSEDYFRWSYTALTRARWKLFCLNKPNIAFFPTIKNKQDKGVKMISNEIYNQATTEELDLPDNLQLDEDFQKNLYNLIKSKLDSKVSIYEIKSRPWMQRYSFMLNEEQSVVDFIYNTKHIITKINPISITTDFTSYYEKLTDLKGNTLDNINNEIEFPDEKPFLQELYDDKANSLNNTNIEIIKIEHLNYCEKYHFKKNNDSAIINYYYNDKGIFTKTHPENNTNTSMELMEEIIGVRNYD